ncbi:MAG: S-layer homology domain-containing protein [Bacillota bacterium]|nr:S-layer homology domain-containing protein [Bacillota bacterium]
MRNFKKLLSLVLCMAVMLSVMVVGAGAAFKDQEKIVNTEAVDMCSALNIINGYEDGSFKPEGNITRAEACKMICIALNGGKEPVLGTNATASFTDIKGHWAEGYIEYCYSEGIVAGVGGGKFDPAGNVTGSQFAKMLLTALGFSADHEKFVGSAWEVNVNVKATQKGLYEDLETMDPSVALTRDNAAQMVWNALQAAEVEYTYTLVTDANGNLTSQVAVKDKVAYYGDNEKYAVTLMVDKYGTSEDKGQLLDWTYDSDKSEWTYAVGNGFYTTDQDYTDLFGMNVKVIYKNKDVYGIVPNDSAVIAEGVLGDIDDLDEIGSKTEEVTIDGVDYKLEKTTGYYFGADKIADVRDVIGYGVEARADANGMDGYEAFPFKVIDNNDNGKIDTIVVYPFTVKEVTFVGAKSFQAGDTYTTEKVNVYEGIAEDDYTIITAKANAVDCKDTFAKAEVISGEVSVVNGEKVTIDGTVYVIGNNINGDALKLGDTVEAVVVNGYIFHAEKVSGIASMDEIVYISGAKVDNDYGTETVIAKATFADGTTAEINVVETSKYQDDAAGTENAKTGEQKIIAAIGANGNHAIDGLYSFDLDDGEYTLKTITTDDGAGTDKGDFDTSATGNKVGKDKIAGLRVNADAVVFVVDKDGDVSVKTGASVAAWGETTVATNGATAYANKTNGVAYTELAVVKMAAGQDTPDASSDAVYAYVIELLGETKEGDTKYSSFKIWTATGEQTIKVKSANAYSDVAKGDFVKYENSKLTELTGTNYAITGLTGAGAVDDILYFDNDNDNSYVITDDTQIIYINAQDTKGAEGALKVASDLDGKDGKEKNVYAAYGSKNSDGDYELTYIFADVQNDIEKKVFN